MAIGEAIGLLGLWRDWLFERPRVEVLAKFHDYGPPLAGVVSIRVGRCVRVEVHCTGRVPVRVTSIGFEMSNGQMLELDGGDSLPAVLNRPDVCERWDYREGVVRLLTAAGPKVRFKRIRVVASPNHVFKPRLPKGWDRFPEVDPPVDAPNEGGPHGFATWA
jgi:hypothetical protein